MKHLNKVSSLLIIASFLWLAGFIFFSVHIMASKPKRLGDTTDAIIVLTGGDKRITAGLNLFAQGRASHLFISGVHPDVTKDHIKSMWKGDTALPPCCITLGHEARTTIGNAQEVKKWIEENKYHEIRLVTSDYHMPRASKEISSAADYIEIISHPIKGSPQTPNSLKFWRLSFSEYNKYLFRSLRLLF